MNKIFIGIILTVFWSIPGNVVASPPQYVPMDYPGLWILGGENKDLPGVPEGDREDYVQEILAWAKKSSPAVPLTEEMANTLIDGAYQPEIGTSTTLLAETAEGIVEETYTPFGAESTIHEAMRDIIALESAQDSIVRWEKDFYDNLGSADVSVSAAYDSAIRIQAEILEVNQALNRNFIVKTLFGAGRTSFFNILASDGMLEGYTDSKVRDLLSSGMTDNLGTWTFKPEALDWAQIGLELFTRTYEALGGASDVSMILKNTTTGIGALGGGLSMVVAPGKIFYDTMTYIAEGFEDASKGAHLLFHYYFCKSENGIIPWEILEGDEISFAAFAGSYAPTAEQINNPVFISLRNYATTKYKILNAATAQQTAAAYGTSTLFTTIRNIDVDHLKRELVSYLFLKYMAQNSTDIEVSRNDSEGNEFTLRPEGVYDADRAGRAINAMWSWKSEGSSDVLDLSSTTYAGVMTPVAVENDVPNYFSLNLQASSATSVDGILALDLTYPDGSHKTGSVGINYLPQHGTLTIIATETATALTFGLTMSGDTSYDAAVLYAQNTAGGEIRALAVYSNDSTSWPLVEGEYHSTVNKSSLGSYGTFKFWYQVDGSTSNVLTIAIPDPNDVDGDGLNDSWEIEFFGDITVTNGDADPDGDGKNNSLEESLNTDPLKIGSEEILSIAEITSDCSRYGALYTNLFLKGGTLDLEGKTLIIKGNLIQSGGTLNVNGGSLIVEGDYRVQTASTDSEGTTTYSRSNGYLNMTNVSDHVLVYGNFVMQSYYNDSSNLTAGLLEVRGDFTQKETDISSVGDNDNFEANGTHRVLLSGTSKQTVTFETPSSSYSHFNILEITNSSTEGVDFASKAVVVSELVATTTPVINALNIQLSGSAIISGGEWDYDLSLDNSASIWTLQQNQVINGNYSLGYNTFDLNGHTLRIGGDLIHSGGTLNVNGGNLIVEGDYRVQTASTDSEGTTTYSRSNGYLNMTNVSDHVLVYGNFVMQSYYNDSSNLTAGLLEVRGDFTQKETDISSVGDNDNFEANGTHRVLLSGTSKQTVTFETPSSSYSHFNILEITNSSTEGVDFASKAVVVSELVATTTPVINALNIQLSGSAIISGGEWDYDLSLDNSASIWTLQQNQVINGNYSLGYNTFDLNGHTLRIGGDLIHSGGTLNVNGGNLIVEGDYRVQTASTDSEGTTTYSRSNGYLNMTNVSDHVLVYGNFVMQSYYNDSSNLTAGLLEVRGDFTQKETDISSVGDNDNFEANGTHRVLLSGTSKQTVTFETPGSGYSHFNILELANESANGVIFSSSISLVTLISNSHALSPITVQSMGWVLQEDTVINGLLNLNYSTLDLNGFTLTVKGDLIHSGGTLNVNGGNLIVEGDYRVQTASTDSEGTTTYSRSNGYLNMTNVSDHVLVYGNFVMQSYYNDSSNLTAGLLEVRGDFTQKETDISSVGDNDNFEANGTHRVLLSGTSKQTVTFETPGSGYSHFNILELANESANGVIFSSSISLVTLISNSHALSPITVQSMGWVLQEDTVINGLLNLNYSTLDLNGFTLTVKGDLIHSGGTLNVNGGNLIVEGDYRVQTASTDSEGTTTYSRSNGYLNMTNVSDHVLVYGNFVMQSYYNDSSNLTAGLLEVRGDFTQKDSESSTYADNDNFGANETHRVLLSGTVQQTVTFETPGSSYSHFNILELANESSDGVLFSSQIVVTTLFSHNHNNFTFAVDDSIFVDYDGDSVADNLDFFPTNVEEWADGDNDGIGDNSDLCLMDANNDADGDGLCADVDNCWLIANADQSDVNGNGLGDACDTLSDSDSDGLKDAAEYACHSDPLDKNSICRPVILPWLNLLLEVQN
nr:hypothetical protein [uncultured Desulfobulbus sp.]